MLYLGIDQHARQITISLRGESGDVLLARQVSTQPEKINAFFQQLTRERLRENEPFVAVLEVCGFNDWLIRLLQDYRCHKVILIQPEERKKRKTDRRDSAALSELLWANGPPHRCVFERSPPRCAVMEMMLGRCVAARPCCSPHARLPMASV
jgi:transposase